MSIQAQWNFNENNATEVLDYSGNGHTSSNEVALSIVAGVVGYAGDFNGTSSYVDFRDPFDLGGNDKLDIMANIYLDASQENIITWKKDQWQLKVNASDKVVFTVTIGASDITLTSTASVSLSTWTTVCGSYDGCKYVHIHRWHP